MIGVTRQHLLEHFIRSGIEWMGRSQEIEGEQERAFFVPTAHIRPEYHRRKFGIAEKVLFEDPRIEERKIA
ncbi:MAG: hypothetical protein K2Y19_13770 [Afipia birgiae]|jgi:acyl homoserine lactone synthase|nr:hypothetical protein [Afipia birgiae]